MTNIEIYKSAFMEVFGVSEELLNDDFSKESIGSWDSVHQLNIITLLEESYNIMLDPEDIMGFTSYGVGREILERYEVDLTA